MVQSIFMDEDNAGVSGHREVTRALARRLLSLSPAAVVLAVVDLWPEKFAETFAPLLDTGTDIVAFSTSAVFSGGRLVEGRPAVAGLCFFGEESALRFDAAGVCKSTPPMTPAQSAMIFSTSRLTNLESLSGVFTHFAPDAPQRFSGGFTMEDPRGRSWVWDRSGVHDSGFVALLSPQRPEMGLSQGMRRLGDPYLVTAAEGPWLKTLAFQPALERLENALENEGNEVDAQLFVGFPYDQAGELRDPEAFLAYPVMGVDREGGALRLTLEVPVGVPAQLMAKNAQGATDGLDRLAQGLKNVMHEARFGVVTSCCARNSRFFGAVGSDAKAFGGAFGVVPHFGWYANGEFFHDHRGLHLVQFSAVVNVAVND